VSPGIMSRMRFTASTIAKLAGRDLLLAAEEITSGVTRGYQACADLDNDFNFLTLDQRSQIRRDFDAQKAGKARTDCFNALEARASLAAKETK
jgi:hypothetical protein